jgi:hypothetical protein
MLFHICQRLQHNSWIFAVNSYPPSAALLEVVHYFSLFVVVGSAVMVDLRILEIAARRRTLAQLGRQLFPSIWIALGFAVLSGFIMFGVAATEYFDDGYFRRKMLIIVAGAVLTAIVQWNAAGWSRLPAMPITAKALAIVSLSLWIGAVLAGLDVAALSGIG